MKKIILVLLLLTARVSFSQDVYCNAVPILDSLTLATGQTLSAGHDLSCYQIFKFYVPASFDGTEITLYSSIDGVTYAPCYNSDNEILKFTVTAGRWYVFKPFDYFWIDRYIKIFSNATASGADKFYLTKGRYYLK